LKDRSEGESAEYGKIQKGWNLVVRAENPVDRAAKGESSDLGIEEVTSVDRCFESDNQEVDDCSDNSKKKCQDVFPVYPWAGGLGFWQNSYDGKS
jgi:hypothetical protein